MGGAFHTDSSSVRQTHHNSPEPLCTSTTLILNFSQLIFKCFFHSLFMINVARSLILLSLKVRAHSFKYTERENVSLLRKTLKKDLELKIFAG